MRTSAYLLGAVLLAACNEPARGRAAEARWAEVVDLAAPKRTHAATSAPLLDAERRIREEHAAVSRLVKKPLRQGKLRPAPRVPPEQLSPGMRQALEELRRWHAEGAALGPLPCFSESPRSGMTPLSLIRLAQLAIAVAEPDPRSPEIRAVAALGERLCASAAGNLPAVVGCSLLSSIREWADDRQVDVRALLAKHLPPPENFLRVMAADAVCRGQSAERLRSRGEEELRQKLGKLLGTDDPQAIAARVEEEIAATRRFLADAVLGARPLLHSPTALRELLESGRTRVMQSGLVLARILGWLPAYNYEKRAKEDRELRAYVGAQPR